MWPLWLIGLVAGILGLSLAITISTLIFIYLHRKIVDLKDTLRQNGLETGINHVRKRSMVDEEQALPANHGRPSFQRDFRMPVAETEEDEDEERLSTPHDDHVAAFGAEGDLKKQIENKTDKVVRPAYHSWHKGTRKRNKLKRSIRMKSISLSPLSAITERSNSPSGSPGPAETNAVVSPVTKPSSKPMLSSISWSLAIAKTRRASPLGSTENVSATAAMLPQITEAHQTLLPPISIRHDRSTHGFGAVAPQPSADLILDSNSSEDVTAYDQYQAWKDFDFGLRSPTLTVASAEACEVGISGATDSNIDHTSKDTVQQSPVSDQDGRWLEQLARHRASSAITGPPGRHSMYVVAQAVKMPSAILSKRSAGNIHQDDRSRPTSLIQTDRPVQSSLKSENHVSDVAIRHHRRQRCVRISGIPIPSPTTTRNGHMLRESMQPPKISFTQIREENASPWPRPLTLRQTKPLSRNKSLHGSDIFIDETPETPLKAQDTVDNDNITPSQQPSSLPRSYDSPILPSPAYTLAGLFPRRPQLHGPRSSQSIMSSPTIRNQFKKRRISTDLRKSIMMLRSMNSEEMLLNKEHGRSNLQHSHRSSFIGRHSGVIGSRTSSLSSTRIGSIAMSNSEISIWEDASVPSDSPEPELSSWSGTSNSILSRHTSIRTPVAKPVQSDDQENRPSMYLVGSHGNNTELEVAHNLRGLNVGMDKSQAWGTPGSLYDELGFLKE